MISTICGKTKQNEKKFIETENKLVVTGGVDRGGKQNKWGGLRGTDLQL